MTAEPALVIGDPRDVHVDAVCRTIVEQGGATPVVIDALSLRQRGFSLVDGSLRAGDRIASTRSGRGWLRRVAPPQWGGGHPGASLAKTEMNAFVALLAGLARASGRRWLTDLSDLARSEDKLLQLQVAAEAGARVPRTVVTSDSDEAADLLGERFLVKPLVTGYFRTPSGGAKAVFATELTREEARAADFGAAPFLAQAVVRAHTHLRAVTVGERVWIGQLPAGPYPVDWRAAPDAHTSWVPATDAVVEKLAVQVAGAACVGYSSQDWLIDDDGPVFLDLNPAGQWLFLPETVATPVTEAIASFLLGRAHG